MLWCWTVHFDPYKKKMDKCHLWLLLLGLPLQFRTKEILVNLANHLGKYIFVNPSLLRASERSLARVLVEFEMFEGLLEEETI